MQKGVVVFVVVEVLVVIVVIVVTVVVVMRQYELAQMKTGTHTISVCTKDSEHNRHCRRRSGRRKKQSPN